MCTNMKTDKSFALKQAFGNEIYVISNKNTQVQIVKIQNQSPQQVFVSHLQYSRVNHAQKMLANMCIINDPEIWLSCILQLINYCLKQEKLLVEQTINKVKFVELYKIAKSRPDFEYFSHTIEYAFIKLGLKYLTLKMYEEALFLAFEMQSSPLVNYIKVMARK